MTKRLIAALAVLAIWTAIVWFTAWDRSPATWPPELRFVVVMIGIVLAGFVACQLIFDED